MKKILFFTIFMMVCAVTQGVVAQNVLQFKGHRPWNWKNVELEDDVFRHIIENSSEVETQEEFDSLTSSFRFRTEAENEPVFFVMKTQEIDELVSGVAAIMLNVKHDNAYIYICCSGKWYRHVTDDPYYIGVYWR